MFPYFHFGCFTYSQYISTFSYTRPSYPVTKPTYRCCYLRCCCGRRRRKRTVGKDWHWTCSVGSPRGRFAGRLSRSGAGDCPCVTGPTRRRRTWCGGGWTWRALARAARCWRGRRQCPSCRCCRTQWGRRKCRLFRTCGDCGCLIRKCYRLK